MRTIWIILLFLSFFIISFGQQKKPNNSFTGISKDTNRNGNVIKETAYANGRKNGVEKIYYESGKLKSEIPYKKNKVNGVEKEYYENGYLKRLKTFTHGKKNGVSKEYGGIYNRLESENMYKNDSLNGLSKVYHTYWKSVRKPACINPYAKSYTDTVIKEGKPTGESENYYVDSLARKEMYYKKGKLIGISKVYGKKGGLQAENTFFDGKLNGISKVYYDDGALKCQMFYKGGRLYRDTTEYDKNGKLKIQTESIFYNQKGQLIADTNYKISQAQIKKIIPVENYLKKYFLEYIDYPEQAKETYDTGYVIVSFEIGNTDTLQQVRIEKVSEKKNYLSNEVKKAFKKFPIPTSAYSKRLSKKRYFLAISFQIMEENYKPPGFVEIKRYIILQTRHGIE